MEMFAFGMKMDEQALEPGTDEIRGNMEPVTILGGRLKIQVPLKRLKERGE